MDIIAGFQARENDGTYHSCRLLVNWIGEIEWGSKEFWKQLRTLKTKENNKDDDDASIFCWT
jgi:hypothetical protein